MCHVLVVVAMDFFQTRYTRQILGFEGKNLIERQKETMEKAALNINSHEIEVSTYIYISLFQALWCTSQCSSATALISWQINYHYGTILVPSQSERGVLHTVDWIHRTCTCHSFQDNAGVIGWCKHLSAARNTLKVVLPAESSRHDHAEPVPMHLPAPATALVPSIDDANAGAGNGIECEGNSVECHGNQDKDDVISKASLCASIQKTLQVAASLESPALSALDIEALRTIQNSLNIFVTASRPPIRGTASILGHAQNLAPNQSTSTETARAMGPIKRKKKSRYSGPYDAGERSGKKVPSIRMNPNAPPAALLSNSATHVFQ